MAESLRILILEDNPTDVELIQFELQEAGLPFISKVVMAEADFVCEIQRYCPDLILSDYDLPRYNGALALAEVRRRCPDTPFILVSGAVSEDRAIEILTQGAKDYVLKNRLQQRLVPAVKRALAEAEEHRARKQAEVELREAYRTMEERVKLRTAELEAEMAVRKRTEDALRKSQGRLKKLYHESPIPTFTWQKKGGDFILVDYNRAAIQLTENKVGEFIGRNAVELYKERPQILSDMNLCYKEQSIIKREITSRHFAPGRFISAHYGFIPPDLIIVHMEDQTERKRSEEEIQQNILRLRRLVNILQYPSETMQDFLDYALEQAIQLTQSKVGYIYHYHDDRKEFVLNTWSKEVMAECAIANPPTCYELDKTGIWGEAVRQRRPIIVNDFNAAHPLKKGYPEGHVQLSNFMTVPIFQNDCVVGVIGLANKETDFEETDILQVSLLTEAVWKVTERKRMEEALRESERRFRELSIIDDLTQLYNSRHFYHQLKREIDRTDRYGQPLTLMLLDIDDFKRFNDTYGHIEGDQVLLRLGQVVKRCLRQTDTAYRYGGEEFTILLPMTPGKAGTVNAERIRTEFKKETFSPAPGQDVHVTVSIGLAQYNPQEEMKAFVHRVDRLMYQAKGNGKNRVYTES